MSVRGLAALATALLVPLVAAQVPEPRPAPPPPIVTSLTLFAGTAEGLWRTTDWGKTWELVRGRTSGSPLETLGAARSILPLGPQVFVAGKGGFFLSNDFGETWEQRGTVVEATCLLISRYPQSDPTVFIGTALGLLKSVDAGRTWQPVKIPSARGGLVALAQNPRLSNRLFAITAVGALLRSQDGGNTWQKVPQ